MRILVVSTLYPLPGNVARGTFVSDNVQLLTKMGHEVKVINPLPRMTRYLEGAKPTLKGVSTAPKEYEFAGDKVYSPKYLALSGGSASWMISNYAGFSATPGILIRRLHPIHAQHRCTELSASLPMTMRRHQMAKEYAK